MAVADLWGERSDAFLLRELEHVSVLALLLRVCGSTAVPVTPLLPLADCSSLPVCRCWTWTQRMTHCYRMPG